MSRAALAALTLWTAAGSDPAGHDQEFAEWMSQHGKRYADAGEVGSVYAKFQRNGELIKDLNDDPEDGAVYGHSRFSDESAEEFVSSRFPFRFDPRDGKRGARVLYADEILEELTAPLLDSVDWRQHGAVTPVKDQSSCGSCWAESAVSNIESAWFLAHKASMKEPVALSVEQVVECDAHDYACYGGYPKGAYKYVIEHGGLASDAEYAYQVKGHTICLANQTYNETCGDGICDDPPLTSACDLTCSDGALTHTAVAKIDSWLALPSDEVAMAAFVSQHGPLSVGLDAAGGALGILIPWLQFYKSGVANPRRCTTSIDHAVLIVGYGEDNGAKYWLIKNSWGEKWGESGYFRLIRGSGKCGIDLMATSAVVKSEAAELLVL